MRHFIFSKFISFFLFSLFFIFTGCAQKQPIVETPVVDDSGAKEEAMRKAIVANALKYLNTKKGKDCSGFVSLVNAENGEPFYQTKELNNSFTNDYRSKAMFNLMKSDSRIILKDTPKIADLVFFSDTLQKTKRKVGSFNITHVGIVTQIDNDGTVHFIHHSRGKNVMGAVNKNYPEIATLNDKNINTYMKRCDSRKPKQECLSPYFFSAYGEMKRSF